MAPSHREPLIHERKGRSSGSQIRNPGGVDIGKSGLVSSTAIVGLLAHGSQGHGLVS